jgi:hypothetical protein
MGARRCVCSRTRVFHLFVQSLNLSFTGMHWNVKGVRSAWQEVDNVNR